MEQVDGKIRKRWLIAYIVSLIPFILVVCSNFLMVAMVFVYHYGNILGMLCYISIMLSLVGFFGTINWYWVYYKRGTKWLLSMIISYFFGLFDIFSKCIVVCFSSENLGGLDEGYLLFAYSLWAICTVYFLYCSIKLYKENRLLKKARVAELSSV